MKRQPFSFQTLLAMTLLAAVGCRPTHPFYLGGNATDLRFYLDRSTSVEYPDVYAERLAEVQGAWPPFTLSDPRFDRYWDLTLEEAISIALHNSNVLRDLGAVISPAAALQRPETMATVYDPAVVESDPQLGIEGALAAFDVQLSSSIFWDKRNRPQNFGFFNPSIKQDVAQFNFQLNKQTATGTQLFFRNVTDYDKNNNPFQAVPSEYTTALEVEARHPLLRGGGTEVNRVPIVLARINTDISLADFDAGVQNLVLDVESAYWDLSCSYRTLEAAKAGRDRALETWRIIDRRVRGGLEPPENEPLVREQYLSFRLALETALRNLQNTENNLRWLLGIAATDGRMIRPADQPTAAIVRFDWNQIHAESLVRSPELRRQKWTIKRHELQLISARNQLLPEVNVVGLYRWLGVGDELVAASSNGIRFPLPGSRAYEELTTGDYQEARFGVELALPIGYRRELAAMRNSELILAREESRLKEMELNASHLLTLATRQLDSDFQFAQTYFNRLIAAESEEEKREALLIRRSDLAFLQALLDAQRRSAQLQADYYRALCDYNKSIALVHYRKGSLLEYNGIRLAEGPWPQKAYLDAYGHARRRNASLYLDYGLTQPPEVTRGSDLPELIPPGRALDAKVIPTALPAPLESSRPTGSQHWGIDPEPIDWPLISSDLMKSPNSGPRDFEEDDIRLLPPVHLTSRP